MNTPYGSTEPPELANRSRVPGSTSLQGTVLVGSFDDGEFIPSGVALPTLFDGSIRVKNGELQ